ncbi:MAG TPA: rhodanese-like domain-containing protein [Gammaproteobacteria bacterium]
MSYIASLIQAIVPLLLFALISTQVSAESPTQIDGATRISAEELITLAGEHPALVLIDSRISANRKHGYIEGSLSLPDTDTTCETLQKFIPTVEAPAAFYCNGVKCGRSATAIKVAIDCGYSHLYWFRGGFDEWKQKRFPYLHQE